MANSTFLIVSLLVIFSFSSLDVGQASRQVLQASPKASTTEVQKTLTEIDSLLKQIHAQLPKNAGATNPSYSSAALQQTLAQLKSIVARNHALLPIDGTSTKSVPATRRLFATHPEEFAESNPSTPSGTPYYNMGPISSLPKFPHLPTEYMTGTIPRLPKTTGMFPVESETEAESPSSIGNPSSPSAAPGPSPTKKPEGFFHKLFNFGA